MGFDFYLYRAEKGLPAMNRWGEMHAEPLGSVEQIKAHLTKLFPQLKWALWSDAWIGSGSGYPEKGPYLEITLSEDTDGQCHFVVLDKAAPSVMRKVMESMNLNYACAPESGDLVDPYAYGDDDTFYARQIAPGNGR